MSDKDISTSSTASTREEAWRPPVGPHGHWLFGTVREFRNDILGTMQKWVKEYGDAVRFRFFLSNYGYLFCHPDHNKHFFQDNNRNYTKLPSPTVGALVPLVGYGLLTSDGESWLRQRRLVQPAFHRQRIQSFSRIMTKATSRLIEAWQSHARQDLVIDVSEEMARLTLEIVGKSLFSVDLTREAQTVGEAFTAVNRQFRQFSSNPFGIQMMKMRWLPRTRRFLGNIAILDEVVWGIINERRRLRERAVGESNDLLDLLMDARDEDSGESMNDRQLRDEVMTLMLAGHETTANALTWTLYLISQHPQVQARLEGEVDQLLGGEPPSFEDVGRLQYTTMVLEEAMRLYPPAYAVTRTAADEDIVGGMRIEKGALISLSAYLTHRHPDFWEDAEVFDPERFSPERKAQRPRYAYIPFGGGPRMCIGNTFAMTEAILIMAMLVQRFRLSHEPDHIVEMEPLITLRPKYGMRMRLTER